MITNAIGLKTDVAVGDGCGIFRDPCDGQLYKTCKIGDQVWLAENLRFDVGEGCRVYQDDYQYLDKYGYMYSYDVLSRAIPEGWHLPTKEEVESMEKFIIKSNRCKSAIPYLKSNDWDKKVRSKRVKDAGFYGFAALPTVTVELRYGNPCQESSWWLKPVKKKLWGKNYTKWMIRASEDCIYFVSLSKGEKIPGEDYIRLIKDN